MKKIIPSILIVLIGMFVFIGFHNTMVYLHNNFLGNSLRGVSWGITVKFYSMIVAIILLISVLYQMWRKENKLMHLSLSVLICLPVTIYFTIHPYRTILLILCTMLSFLVTQILFMIVKNKSKML
jgi:hypothetical protein